MHRENHPTLHALCVSVFSVLNMARITSRSKTYYDTGIAVFLFGLKKGVFTTRAPTR